MYNTYVHCAFTNTYSSSLQYYTLQNILFSVAVAQTAVAIIQHKNKKYITDYKGRKTKKTT